MNVSVRRGFYVAALLSVFAASVSAETIIKQTLGATGPDIEMIDGVLSTVDDGNVGTPGDQQTSISFHGFVEGQAGVVDISPPDQGSFTLDGIVAVGSPVVQDRGIFTTVEQQTTGGTFEVYGKDGEVILTGTLANGFLSGTSGAAATGGFITANLASFTGPSDPGLNYLFSLLDPNSASLAVSLTDVSGPNGEPGLSVTNGAVDNFTADAIASIGAEALNNPLPEPASSVLALMAMLGALGFRNRR